MKIGTCMIDGKQRLVRKDENNVVVIEEEFGTSLREILADDRLSELASATGVSVGESELTFLSPIPNPEKIFAVGLNYRGHVLETGGTLPEYPSLFFRLPSSLVGHGEPVIVPSVSTELDYEAELAVVIGKHAYRVSEADAMHYVAGYTCFAENSVRDYQMHARQVTAGKNFFASGAIGPWLTTADEIPDPAQLKIIGRLNGDIVQSDDLTHLVFSIPQLIEYITEFTPLVPGDIISTGTPDGVGFLRDPKIWLRPGDVFEIDVPGVGLLSNPVAAEKV
jgi:2-keto-4-pentenoate hydratase/2-oxohepta-3-ene-1,7-dioic acid hydratase in catechol pathway